MSGILPAQLAAAIKACVYACTITVTPGHYGALHLSNLRPIMGAAIELAGTTFTSIELTGDENITIFGGIVSGAGNAYGQCWLVDYGRNIKLNGVEAEGCATVGFMLSRSSNVTLDYWTAKKMRCDAVDLAGIDRGKVMNGRETESIGVEACHPDAVQGWSYGTYELKHIVISGNTAISGDFVRPDGVTRGQMGYDIWNNNGPNGAPLPVEDIQITNNVVATFGGSCVGVAHIKSLVVRRNKCFNMNPEPWSAQYLVADCSIIFEMDELDDLPATLVPLN